LSLGERQLAAFKFTASAVNPRQGGLGVNKVRKGNVYPDTFDFEDFACHVTAGKETLDPTPIGLSVHDNLESLDVLRCSSEIELEPSAYVRVETGGHPYEGKWFTVQGPAQAMVWRAGTTVYRLKKATVPPGWEE